MLSRALGIRSLRIGSRTPIERASPTDLMELASNVPDSPMEIAAILVLDAAVPDLAAAREALATRILSVPRLRQRLVPTPFGGGRPHWVDDPGFDLRNHVRSARCPEPGDEPALLGLAAQAATRRLPPDRPLWAATLVAGLDGGRSALIVVFHHVLADGIGGLALLAHLVDGEPVGPPGPVGSAAPVAHFPRRAPLRRDLILDSAGSHLRALGRLPAGVGRLRAAVAELALSPAPTPRTSLNRPTGPRRSLAVARADLAPVLAVARAHGGTVNDVVLSAVAGALRTLLNSRGEDTERLVVSVPISARRTTSAARLGNEVGLLPVAVPTGGPPRVRLAAIARITAGRKTGSPGASAAIIGPTFRVLARLGAFAWLIDYQRFVTTFVTNLRGPPARLSFLGAPVSRIIPVSTISGNITVGFAAMSYSGSLVVTVVADPERCADLPVLVEALQRELDAVVGAAVVGDEAQSG